MKFFYLLLILVAAERSTAEADDNRVPDIGDNQENDDDFNTISNLEDNENDPFEDAEDIEAIENGRQEGDAEDATEDEAKDEAAIATHHIHHIFKKCFSLRQCRARSCQPCYNQCLIVSCRQGRCRILCSKMCHSYRHCLNKRRHCAYKYLRIGCRWGLTYKRYWYN